MVAKLLYIYEGAGVKRSRREADHSPPTSAEVNKKWIYYTVCLTTVPVSPTTDSRMVG
jgi:hypothetical protein